MDKPNMLTTYTPQSSFPTLERIASEPIWLKLYGEKIPAPSKRSQNGGDKFNRWLYLKNLIRNLYDFQGCIHVRRGDHHYTERQRSGNVPPYYTRAHMKAIVAKLVEAGFVEKIKGRWDKHNKSESRLTMLIAVGELADRITLAHEINKFSKSVMDMDEEAYFASVPPPLRKYLPQDFQRTDTLTVKAKTPNGDKVEVPFEKTESLQRFEQWMDNVATSYDERGVIFRYVSSETGEVVTPTFRLTSSIPERVLSLADRTGGYRFYHRLQLIKKATERPTVTISGHPTAEVDLTACHMAILYALVNGDRYDHDRDFYTQVVKHLNADGDAKAVRQIVKLMTNIALNAEDITQTLRAFNSKLQDLDIDVRKAYDQLMGIERKGGLIVRRERQTVDLLDAIKTVRGDIAEYFASDVGVKLMAIESQIMRDIIDRLWFSPHDVAKEPVIPVHDGFLVREQAEDVAHIAMREAFNFTVSQYTADILK